MTKRLQKKLKQLEDLRYVFDNIPYDKLVSEKIEQRFLFVKNLLSAEISSHPSSKPKHLHHIEQRLAEWESAFREWRDDHRRRSTSDDVNNYVSDSASICSCRDMPFEIGSSSVYEVEGDGLNLKFPRPEGRLVDVIVEQEDMGKKKARGTDDDDDIDGSAVLNVKQEKGMSSSGYVGGLMTGMISGAVLSGLIALCFSGCCYFTIFTAQEHFLIPT